MGDAFAQEVGSQGKQALEAAEDLLDFDLHGPGLLFCGWVCASTIEDFTEEEAVVVLHADGGRYGKGFGSGDDEAPALGPVEGAGDTSFITGVGEGGDLEDGGAGGIVRRRGGHTELIGVPVENFIRISEAGFDEEPQGGADGDG
ncbi:MAG: hypothetical protein JO091_04065 [Acidobacteriaceae bacterium]|nr:hypothetical protein [Acidobacteriaceae bacterium]